MQISELAPAVAARHDPVTMLTGAQIRAALALLRWTHAELATAAGISEATAQRAAKVDGVPDLRARMLAAIQVALEDGGVVFLGPGEMRDGGAGVRLRRQP